MNHNLRSGGVGLGTLALIATIVLAVLKVAGPLADLAWWHVLLPLLVVIGLGLAVGLLTLLAGLLFVLVAGRGRR